MPFTFAHPAAALPFAGPLRRYRLLSAFVIGSMTPDFWYFLPLDALRAETHTLRALFTFCLPWGVFVYLVFHLVMLRPALSLLAPALRRAPEPPLPTSPLFWCGVGLSLLLGALTHIAWDGVTHLTGPGVQAYPALQAVLPLGTLRLPVYLVLQYLSTALGLPLTAWWLVRELKRGPRATMADPWPAALPGRGAVAGLLLLPLVWAIVSRLDLLRFGLASFARFAFGRSVGVFWLALLIFSLCWWFGRWRSRERRAG